MRVELLKDVKLRTASGEILSHRVGDRLSLPDRMARRIIDKGHGRQVFSPPVKYESKLLGKTIWLVNDLSQFKEAETRDPGLVVYTTWEYYLLLWKTKKKYAKASHEVKRVFPSSIILGPKMARIDTIFDGSRLKTEPGNDTTGTESNTEKEIANMKLNEMFPSRFMSKDDLAVSKVFTIATIEMEEVENEDGKETKPVIYFDEKESKPLILNKTNAEVLRDEFGPDSDDWSGSLVELYVDPNVKFGSKKIGGIRVRKPSLSPNLTA